MTIIKLVSTLAGVIIGHLLYYIVLEPLFDYIAARRGNKGVNIKNEYQQKH